MPNDIIYILKSELDTDELRYSLRSVEENFPHRYVWFIGGQPKGFKPDRAIAHKQTGPTKWDQIKSSMWKAVMNDELTEEFYLFNDDFFVMQRFTGKFINYADRTLTDRIEDFRLENPWLVPYARTLVKAREELKSMGCGQVNFEVHLPMLMEKQKVISSINKCSSPQMRSVYGNINAIAYVQHDDVKVYDLDNVPKCPDFLSTNDKTFTHGKVGEYIRATFTRPSRFEV